MEKMEEKQAPNNTSPHRQPNFLSEMKVVLGKQAQPVENKTEEGGEGTNMIKCVTYTFVSAKEHFFR